MGDGPTLDEFVLHEVTLDALTVDVQVYQRRDGHRFSSDDVVTAWCAMRHRPRPTRVLDLGCGLGSVLLHLAWSAPMAALAGIEAQEQSYELLVRNIAHNGLADRVAAYHGDLRDRALLDAIAEAHGPFDLVTGTPPYFPPGAATDAKDSQRAHARIEYRGGIEDYVASGARVLRDDGVFAVCGPPDARSRLDAALSATDLVVVEECVVRGRAERPPLFAVWTMRHTAFASDAPLARVMTLRTAEGERTDDARTMRAFSGFPER
jgi:tRNA1Val (adenine37-N6)-methyltransferase